MESLARAFFLAAILAWSGSTAAIGGSKETQGEPRLGKPYAAKASAGSDLLGKQPPEWDVKDWHNSPPLSLHGLLGKIVLIRWWTAPNCPYCAASADALTEFAEQYRDQGLVVIGIYHHKERTPLDPARVWAHAKQLGFTFPLAIDHDWKTLHRWWLDSGDRDWTSVTFLLGRDGKIRHIHGGGAYYPGEPGYDALRRAIEKEISQTSELKPKSRSPR